MNGVVTAAIVVTAFFAAGVVLGVTVIIALSVTGRRREARTRSRYDDLVRQSRQAGPDPNDGDDTGTT